MGNKPVKIGLKLDHTSYEAGSVLTGRVYLSISGQEARRARGVHLLLVGQEVSVVAHDSQQDHGHTSGSSHSSREHQVERSTTCLVHLDVPLTTFDAGTVEPGQYEYPFEWELPMDLPGTMRCNKHADSYCEVTYQLTAYLHSGKRRSTNLWNNNSTTAHADASSVVHVCIVAKPVSDHHPKPIYMEPEEFPIKQCCWIRQGNVSLGFQVDSAVASPRSMVRVQVMGKNASLLPIKHVSVKWTETVSWNARGHAQSIERILDESILPIHARREWQALERLPNKHYSLPNTTVYASLQHPSSQGLQSSLHIPPDARDSYQGRLIQVRHALVVTAVTRDNCCITNPESCALVQIERQGPVTTVHENRGVATAIQQDEINNHDLFPHENTNIPTDTTTAEVVEPSAPLEEQNDVFVQANVLPADWSAQTANVVTLTVPSAHVMQDNTSRDAAPCAPLEACLLQHDSEMTFEQLQQSLQLSSNPMELVTEHWIGNPTICTLVQNATPHDYVALLQSIKHAASQTPQVARTLALVMNDSFTCNHVLACTWALPEYIRLQVLQQVAPLAADLDKNRKGMESQLTSVELLHFRAALR